MTIAVSIKVHDGIVLASDSASSLMRINADGEQSVVNVHDHANKIFNLYKGLPIGGKTYGAGSIGHASISTLAKDLRKRFQGDADFKEWHINRQNYTIEEVAVSVRKFLYEELYKPTFKDKKNAPYLGFRVAGFSSGAALSELWGIEILDGECPEPILLRTQEDCGIDSAGDPEAISRLVMGYSLALPSILESMGMKKEDVLAAIQIIHSRLEANLAPAPMPIQDVIELAKFLVDTTVKFTRFKPGAPTVGGAIEIAAITKHEGFKWVQRKHYFDTDLNLEVNHGA